MNPWDGSLTQSKASFLENLFLTTGDETWKERADQTWDRILELEASDGSLKFEKAESLTRRAAFLPSGENVTAAQRAWDEADQALPFDAFVKFEEATFYYRGVQEKGGFGTFVVWIMVLGLLLVFGRLRISNPISPRLGISWAFAIGGWETIGVIAKGRLGKVFRERTTILRRPEN